MIGRPPARAARSFWAYSDATGALLLRRFCLLGLLVRASGIVRTTCLCPPLLRVAESVRLAWVPLFLLGCGWSLGYRSPACVGLGPKLPRVKKPAVAVVPVPVECRCLQRRGGGGGELPLGRRAGSSAHRGVWVTGVLGVLEFLCGVLLVLISLLHTQTTCTQNTPRVDDCTV